MTLTESMFENLNAPTEEVVAPVITQAEVQPAPEPTPEPEQPAPEPAPQPEVQPEPVVEAPKPEHQTVPLSVLMAQRDETQQIKRRNAELEAQLQQRQSQPEIPDPIDDPNGFAMHLRNEAQQMATAIRFETSYEMAVEKYGNETVETAKQWAIEKSASDPVFDADMGRQKHPLNWIVQQHKRETDFAALGSKSLEDWFREEATKRGLAPVVPAPAAVAAPVTTMVQPAPVVVAQPPRSLANAPGSGGGVADVPTGPMSALGAVFK